MGIKQDLRAMATPADAIAYYQNYIGDNKRIRLRELYKTIGDCEKEIAEIERNLDPRAKELIIMRIGELIVEGL